MSQIIDLFDAANKVEGPAVSLASDVQAFHLFLEQLDCEAYQHPDNEIDPTKAIMFIARYPLYSDMLQALITSIASHVDELKRAIACIYKAQTENPDKEKEEVPND